MTTNPKTTDAERALEEIDTIATQPRFFYWKAPWVSLERLSISSFKTIRATPAPMAEDVRDVFHPHSYEKRVLDSIAHIRAEIEKGFYHPDKEPLEVIMYAAKESLK